MTLFLEHFFNWIETYFFLYLIDSDTQIELKFSWIGKTNDHSNGLLKVYYSDMINLTTITIHILIWIGILTQFARDSPVTFSNNDFDCFKWWSIVANLPANLWRNVLEFRLWKHLHIFYSYQIFSSLKFSLPFNEVDTFFLKD